MFNDRINLNNIEEFKPHVIGNLLHFRYEEMGQYFFMEVIIIQRTESS